MKIVLHDIVECLSNWSSTFEKFAECSLTTNLQKKICLEIFRWDFDFGKFKYKSLENQIDEWKWKFEF